MVEILSAILTGLFTGLGVGIANYVNETRTRKLLEHIDNRFKTADLRIKKAVDELR